LFEEQRAYRYINLHRSAISAFHPQIPNPSGGLTDVGKHPRVCELLAGISKERPPKAKYGETWDVTKVIDTFRSKGPNEDLSLKEISLKLVMLISLTSLNRGMETHRLTLEGMNISSDKVVFEIGGIVKHSKQGKPNPPCIIHSFAQDTLVCPKACLEAYLNATKLLRESSDKGPLFISYAKPHKPVGRDTLRRWMVLSIEGAGVDSDRFKPHSVRGAAGTKARNAGVPLENILAMGNWSNKTTFERFYFKPVKSSTQVVQEGILSALN
jgi:hypothetical protein